MNDFQWNQRRALTAFVETAQTSVRAIRALLPEEDSLPEGVTPEQLRSLETKILDLFQSVRTAPTL